MAKKNVETIKQLIQDQAGFKFKELKEMLETVNQNVGQNHQKLIQKLNRIKRDLKQSVETCQCKCLQELNDKFSEWENKFVTQVGKQTRKVNE